MRTITGGGATGIAPASRRAALDRGAAEGEATMTRRNIWRRWKGPGGAPATLLAGLLVAVLPAALAGRVTARQEAAEESPGTEESTTRRLLDALDERRMHDVVLVVLDRVGEDPAYGADFRRGIPLWRATALTGMARRETPGPRRATLLEQASEQVDRALAGGPDEDQAIAAYTQKGGLLVERARLKLAQAKRPGEDAARLAQEAVPLFDAAIAALAAPPREPGAEISPATNAEDAVLLALRGVDARIAAIKGGGREKEGEGAAGKKARRTPKKNASDVKRLEALEDRQDKLRAELLQTRLLAGNAISEKAKAFSTGSAEWKQFVREAAGRYRQLFEKYPKWGAGLYARYYEGRAYAALAQAETVPEERRKLFETALLTLANVRGLEGESGFVPSLRAKAINASLEAWLETKQYDAFDQRLERLAMANVPADRLDAEWLGMKYRAARLLAEKAEGLPADQRARKPAMLRDAKKLATEVARRNRDLAREARALLESLGRAVVDDDDDDPAQVFASAYDIAAGAMTAMQEKQAEAKAAAAAGKAEEAAAAEAAAATERSRAIDSLRRALVRGEGIPPDDLNRARALLTFLLYDGHRHHDAAVLGTFLAERYPGAKGARQAAKIAMASWQALGKEGPEAWRGAARARMADLAGTIVRTWPKEAEAADAAQVAIAAAAEAHDVERLTSIVAAVPPDAVKGHETLLRAGGALWREVLERRRMPEDARPPAEQLAAWKATSIDALDRGLAAVPAGVPAGPVAVSGGLARLQIAMEDGDDALAARLVDQPQWGAWPLLSSGGLTGTLAENAAAVALRYFIQAQALDKAQEAMQKLEAAAGSGPEAAAKLTGIYLAMGRDLQGQLEALAAGGAGAESDPRVAALLAGFERFLDGVAKRDPKVASQMWVATTYLSLGSGTGSGSVVPKAKTSAYLGRAAEVLQGLLSKAEAAPEAGAEDLTRFVPAIRLKLAGVCRELGRWEEALAQIDWILSDPRRQNALDVQVQAAETIQAAGERSTDAAAGARWLREAIAGRKSGGGVAWGWGGIANRLARQAADPRATDVRTKFFEARLAVVRCRLALLEKPGQDKAKLLQMAANDVAITYRLYPDLGGDATRAQFDALLRRIQKERGDAVPRGLAELDDAAAAPAGAGPS